MRELNNPWHLNRYPEKLLKTRYIEWKYFNFSSPELSGVFVYLVNDPLSAKGGGRLLARLYKSGRAVGGVARFKTQDIVYSDETAAAHLGQGNEIAAGGKTYRIRGAVRSVSWNLRYTPLASPIDAFADFQVDPWGIEKASWFVKMPKAKVSGEVKIGARKHKVNTLGYSDANWGDIIPLVTTFNWAQFGDKHLSVVMGEMENFEFKRLKFGRWAGVYVDFGGRRIAFKEREISVSHSNYARIAGTPFDVPRSTIIQAENRDYKLLLVSDALVSDPLRYELMPLLPLRPVTIEQPSLFTGSLARKSGAALKTLHEINSRGFVECTLRGLEFPDKRLRAGVLV